MLHLANKTKLNKSDRYSSLSKFSVYYNCKNMKVKVSVPRRNDKFGISD